MKSHEQFAEDLALYAMGALDDQHCPELQAHLATCAECRRELEALRADMALLALSATGPHPPQRSRRRLMDAMAVGPREERRVKTRPGTDRPRPRWFTLAPIAVAVILAIISAGLLQQVRQLRQALSDEKQNSAHAKALLDMMNDPKAQHMTLVAARASRQPQVKTIYQKDQGHVLLMASNLEPIPDNKVYELWLIPMSGEPMPCGTFRIDHHGNSMMMHAMETAGIEAKAFAVTVEPVGGSKTPSSPIMYAPAG